MLPAFHPPHQPARCRTAIPAAAKRAACRPKGCGPKVPPDRPQAQHVGARNEAAACAPRNTPPSIGRLRRIASLIHGDTTCLGGSTSSPAAAELSGAASCYSTCLAVPLIRLRAAGQAAAAVEGALFCLPRRPPNRWLLRGVIKSELAPRLLLPSPARRTKLMTPPAGRRRPRCTTYPTSQQASRSRPL